MGSIAQTPSTDMVIDNRRQHVAALAIRGLTVRQITNALPALGCVNPNSNTPWVFETVKNDVRALTREWRENAARDTANHKAELLAQIREVRREAWKGKEPNLQVILRSIEQEAKLFGLDAPVKIQAVSPEDAFAIQIEGMTDEQLGVLSVILDTTATPVGDEPTAGGGDAPAGEEEAGGAESLRISEAGVDAD